MRFSFVTFLFISSVSLAKIKVVTTTTELAWLAKQIGKTHVEVTSLLQGSENPHFLDANPNFILTVANADVFCVNGMELEASWAPRVLKKSANAKVQKGGAGFCDAAKLVETMESKSQKSIDRSQGDIHPHGNPHYTMSPKQMIKAAETVAEVLAQNDISRAEYYLQSFKKVRTKLLNLHSQSQLQFKNHPGAKLMQYHKEFSYFFRDYGFNDLGAIEETPGIPPSAFRLVKVAQNSKISGVQLYLSTHQYPKNHLKKVSELSGIRYLIVPGHLSKKYEFNYIKYHQDLVKKVVKALDGK